MDFDGCTLASRLFLDAMWGNVFRKDGKWSAFHGNPVKTLNVTVVDTIV